MRSAIALLTILIGTPIIGLAQSADAPVLSLTLEDAVARGLAASHRVAAASAGRDALDAAVDERRSAARPQVAAIAGYTRTNHVDVFGLPLPDNQLRVIYPDIPDNYRARLDVQWPLYTGGRLDALTEAARLESSAAADDIDALRADLRFEIASAFWALFVADESLRVVDASLANVGAHLRDVRNQLDAGLVPPNDVLTVQAQESRQRMLSIQARSSRDVAEAGLARLIGVAPTTRIQAVAAPEPPAADAAFDALVAQALDQRPDRRALLTRLTGAVSRQRAAEAGRRPTIALAGGVDYANPNARIFPRRDAWQESWDASVNMSWPLFDGGRTRAEIAGSAAATRALRARADEFDSLIALDVRQRLAEMAATRAAIAAADDAVRAATEARRVVGDRFSAGVASSTDVLDAQTAVLQASLDRTQAIVNARLADARLQRALGR